MVERIWQRIKDAVWRLSQMEPAVVRGAVAALVTLLGSIGIVTSPDIPDVVIGIWVPLVAMIQALWTRRAVTPNSKVVVMMPDPQVSSSHVVPGDAIPETLDGDMQEKIIQAAYDTPAQ